MPRGPTDDLTRNAAVTRFIGQAQGELDSRKDDAVRMWFRVLLLLLLVDSFLTFFFLFLFSPFRQTLAFTAELGPGLGCR